MRAVLVQLATSAVAVLAYSLLLLAVYAPRAHRNGYRQGWRDATRLDPKAPPARVSTPSWLP